LCVVAIAVPKETGVQFFIRSFDSIDVCSAQPLRARKDLPVGLLRHAQHFHVIHFGRKGADGFALLAARRAEKRRRRDQNDSLHGSGILS
jgi:hypothetical protein